MSVDIGPFQEVVGISFPAEDNPEDFVYGEPILFRADCADPDTEEDHGKVVLRIPVTGLQTTLCICTDPGFSGGYKCFTLKFQVPLNITWPDCLIGATSGAKIRKQWPDEPANWGDGPDPIASAVGGGHCAFPEWYSGSESGGQYGVTMTFCTECQGSVGAPDDCCG